MAKRGHKLQEFIAHASDVNCLNIGKKSSRVFITGGADRKVNLWAIGKPTPLLSLAGHTSSVESVAFDSAEVLVLAGSSNGSIRLWDLEEAKIVRTLTGHKSNCTSVEFHPFGEFFASGSLDTDLKIWDIRKKGCIHTYKGHTRGIRTTKFTPDGRWVVTGGEDNEVKLWDLTAGKLLHNFRFHIGQIRCIDFHPHEFLLATGSADRTVKFWDLETFELIGSVGPEVSGVRSIIFHPDGRTLFCGLDETFKVFSWEPIVCHDVVDMGWSTLGDLGIYEGKLVGCSFHENRVGVWVADVSLVGPYAASALPNSNSLAEPICGLGECHSFELVESSTKPGLVTGCPDYGNKTGETAKATECNQNVRQDINSIYASNMNSMSSTRYRRVKTNVSSHAAPQRFDSRFPSKVSTLNSTTFRIVKASECSPNAPERTESNFPSKHSSLNSRTVGANSSFTSKKGPVMEACIIKSTQASDRPISMPVIVPRDSQGQETAVVSGEVTASAEATSYDAVLCKPIHMRKPSFVVGGDESQLITTESGPSNGMSSSLEGVGSLSRLTVRGEMVEQVEENHFSTRNIAEKFERNLSLEEPSQSQNEKYAESPSSSSETSSVKYVRGVAVQLGRTRSLVESWERKESSNNNYTVTINSSSDRSLRADNSSSLRKGHEQSCERDLTSADDGFSPEILVQNHDVFINLVKSRLTKLQAVRHFWEQSGMNGAIGAIAKLPDHSVQVDVISILKERVGLFTLDLFSSLLPLLSGLLISKTERHITISLETLLELVKIFGPVVHSTMSSSSRMGVDLQAERRLEHCIHCFNYLERIKKLLPSLIRKGGQLMKLAQELNLALHGS